jgi:uncharacterized metal-binding protein YceD (DUF177 family)
VTASEFSRRIEVARLGAGPASYDLKASDSERVALARRFGLVALDRFAAHVTLRRLAGSMVRMEASLDADLVQTDVVTLDPAPNHVQDTFTLLFGNDADDAAALDPEAELVEPLEDGHIDIGEAVAQQLSLAIDPYPRAGEAKADSATH